MLTRWAISLQSYDFTVQHRPGKQNVMPDMLSRLVAFEDREILRAPLALAPICRNVPENPALHGVSPRDSFGLTMDNLTQIEPVMSDRDLLSAEPSHISATNVFMSLDPDKLKEEQQREYGPYLRYLTDDDAPLPPQETIASMSYYFLKEGF